MGHSVKEMESSSSSTPSSTTPAAKGFTVRAAGPEADIAVCEYWRKMWLENGVPECGLLPAPEFNSSTLQFIEQARATLGYSTFIAVDDSTGETIGSACCQEWAGPMPTSLSEEDARYGTVWGVYTHPDHRRRGVATQIIQRVKDHWESIGCAKGVLIHASEAGRRVYQSTGFGPGEMLTLDLSATLPNPAPELPQHVQILEQPLDATNIHSTILNHMRLARREADLCELGEAGELHLVEFLHSAQHTQSTTFSAVLPNGTVIGSVVSSQWKGPIPLVLQPEALKFGTCWGLYVTPEWRCGGIGQALIQRCIDHWKCIQCQKGLVMCSPMGHRLCLRMGFEAGNAMVVKLSGSSDGSAWLIQLLKQRLGDMFDGLDRDLRVLLTALPQQLQVARSEGRITASVLETVLRMQDEFSLVSREGNNWFVRNIARFGSGFDMKALREQPLKLANKFDRLAAKYDHWVVGNQSQVEGWVGRMCSNRCSGEGTESMTVADIACGIGLPGQTMRLCGYSGELLGCDISARMVERTVRRGAYNQVTIADANSSLPWEDSIADIVICTGVSG